MANRCWRIGAILGGASLALAGLALAQAADPGILGELLSDLEALTDLDALREEIRRGRESASSEPLLEDDEVVRSVLERLS